MKQIHQNIKQNLKLIFSVAIFFVLVNALNLNAAGNIDLYWKLAGAILVVLYIATIKVDDIAELSSIDTVPNSQ